MVKLSVTEAWIAILSVFLILAPVLTQTEGRPLHKSVHALMSAIMTTN